MEVPAYLLMQPLGERLGRRRTWAGFLGLAGGSLLLLGLLEAGAEATAAPAAGASGAHTAPASPPALLVLLLALLARCGGAGCSALSYVAAAEQFPTGCRNSAIGFGAACGRVASMTAPIAVHLLPAPFLVLAAIACAAGLAALALPETAGKPITEVSHVDETEMATMPMAPLPGSWAGAAKLPTEQESRSLLPEVAGKSA